MGPPRDSAAGVLRTRPVRFSHECARHLFVNVLLSSVGELRAEVLPENVTSGCVPAVFSLRGALDSTRAKMARDPAYGKLDCLAEQPVRIHFNLTGGTSRLYAFWIAPDDKGSSGGYLAGGAIGGRTIVDGG